MSDDSIQSEAMKSRGRRLVEAGQYQEAKALYADICRRDPEDADAWFMLSSVNGMLGDIEEAGNCSRRAIALRPDHVQAHINLGNVLVHQGKREEALTQYQTALEHSRDNPAIHNNLGYLLFILGRLGEAEAHYRAAIRCNPKLVEAYLNLGNVQVVNKAYADAVGNFRRALAINPSHPRINDIKRHAPVLAQGVPSEQAKDLFRELCDAAPTEATWWYYLGSVCGMTGDFPAAEHQLRKAVALDPNYGDAYIDLGNALYHQSKYDEALTEYRNALRLSPDQARLHNNLGYVLSEMGRYAEAEESYEAAIRIDPNVAEVYYGLATAQWRRGELVKAADSLRQAIRLKPEFAGAHNDLGNVLYALRQIDEAVEHWRRAVELNPDDVAGRTNLGIGLTERGDLAAASATFEKALQLQPDLATVYANLVPLRNLQGRPEEALECARKTLELDPHNADIGSSLLMTIHYLPRNSAKDFLEASLKWAAVHAAAAQPLGPHLNSPDAQRRLRVGYVSGDFFSHPVGYFLEPVLEHRDRSAYEVVCYYNNTREDDQTRRLRQSSDRWIDVARMSADELARQIYEDRVDILVDLSGHTALNCLPSFAYRPAPVQATWLGYFDTTGLEAMDYIIADRLVIPPEDEQYYVERVERLPDSYLCFSEPHYPIEVSTLPALSAGRITFGGFHMAAKLRPAVIACWAKILRALPDTQLFLRYKGFQDDELCNRYRDLFAEHGVEPERVRFFGSAPRRELLTAYREVDIALDPFPYTGGTTTAEALWMGVPVITLCGKGFVSRVASTILSVAGLDEFVADTEEDYVRKAVELASDLDRLSALRADLRRRILKSPLFDGPAFAAALEALYRRIWQRWCRPRAADKR